MTAACRICSRTNSRSAATPPQPRGRWAAPADAATDWKMNAELLSYSRAKGLFAGIDLDGTSVSQNNEDTELYYGGPEDFNKVLARRCRRARPAQCRLCAMSRSTSSKPRPPTKPPIA